MSELVFVAKWEYQDAEFKRMVADVDTAKAKVHESSDSMARDFLDVAGNVAHATTAFQSFGNVIERVQKGEMDVGHAILSMIPSVVSLTSALWSLVSVEKVLAIVSGIRSVVQTGGLSLPIVIGAAALAALGLTAVVASIPEHHYEGVIPRSGVYMLAAGQPIGAPGASSTTSNNFTINVYGGQDGRKIGRDIMEELRAGGYT